MARAIHQRQFMYLLLEDRELPPGLRTTFWLKRLSAEENAQIEDAVEYGAKLNAKGEPGELLIKTPRGTTAVEMLRVGLVKWENLLDEDGKPIPFTAPGDDKMCPMVNIDQLSPAQRHELADAIEEGRGLSEEELKNLPSEPTSQAGE